MTDKPKLATIIGNLILTEHRIETLHDYIYLYRHGCYMLDDKELFLRKQIRNKLGPTYSTYHVRETIAYIKDTTRIIDNIRLPYVSLRNFNINTNNLATSEHTPELFITNRVNVKYDPAIDTDEWEDYLSQVIPDEEHLMTLQEYIGYGFIPDQRAKKALFIDGPKDSGKSTLLNIIIAFFGETNCSNLSLDQLCQKFSNFNIYDKMMNIRSDIDYRVDIASVNIIKSLTGDDPIEIERKFHDTFPYKNRAKILLSGNGVPHIPRSADDSFYDRWLPIECPNSFKKKDPTYYQRFITPEAQSAILNWALDGLKRLKKNNWQFTYAPSSEEIKEWFSRGNIKTMVERFISKKCFVSPDEFELKGDLYKAYIDWCKEEGILVLEPNVFHKQVKNNRLFQVKLYRPRSEDGSQQYAWRGLWLIDTYNRKKGLSYRGQVE